MSTYLVLYLLSLLPFAVAGSALTIILMQITDFKPGKTERNLTIFGGGIFFYMLGLTLRFTLNTPVPPIIVPVEIPDSDSSDTPEDTQDTLEDFSEEENEKLLNTVKEALRNRNNIR